jgi:inner membrane transporter RhtA
VLERARSDRPAAPGRAPSHHRAAVLVLAQIASLQLGAVLAKHVIAQVGGLATAALRICLAAVIVGAIARPALRQIRRADLPLLLGFGVALAVMNACFFQAIDRLPLGVATTIEFLGPLAVVVGTALGPRDLAWGAMAAAGVALLTWTGGPLDPVGLAFAGVAAACRALYILCSQAVGRRYHDSTGLCVALAVGAIVALPPGLIATGGAMLAPGILLGGLGIALLSSAIPYALDMAALRRLPARTFSVLISLAPAAAALFGYALLDQRLRSLQLAGIALVVLASLGALTSSRAPDAGPTATPS